MLFSWWRSIVKSTKNKINSSRRGPRGRARSRPCFRPVVEQFEQRVVPTAISMSTNLTALRGGVVTVPINVDNLNPDVSNANTGGFGSATFVVFYNTNTFVASASGVHLGTVPSSVTGFTVQTNDNTPGQLNIIVFTNSGVVSTSGGGSLVTIDFQVKATAPFGLSRIDLAADALGSPPLTGVADQSGKSYILNPAPQDGDDSTDGIVNINGPDQAPVATDKSFTFTARAAAGGPNLTVAAPGVLANDTDPDGDGLVAIKTSDPAHGTVTISSDGSFIYSSNADYVGPDSFTYVANDGLLNSNTATVHLTVTPRLSIPSNLSGIPGGTVVVPVNIDNPNPQGSGGLVGVVLAIGYDPVVFTVANSDVDRGTATAGWNFSANVNPVTGLIGISLSSPGTPNTDTAPGSVVLITFHVNGNAPGGPSAINLMASNAPSGNTVTTRLDFQNGQLPLIPAATNGIDPGVDGLVSIQGTHFLIAGTPSTATAGNAFSFTVTALDENDSTLTSYTGTVHFSSSDAAAVLPADATLTSGTGSFSATLKTVGNQIIMTSDPVANATGTSPNIAVSAAAATHFDVSAPSAATAGVAFDFTVTALDSLNNTAAGYSGVVHFTSSDGQAGLPANVTLSGGVGTFSATLKTAGSQTLTATDTANSSVNGISAAIDVSAVAATHLGINAPASVTPGTQFDFIVTALDPFNNTDTTYDGTVVFSITDAEASVPVGQALTNGIGTFSAVLQTVGFQTLTAADNVVSSINGVASIAVSTTNTATHFQVSAPANATAGVPFSFTVTALDQDNNPTNNYSGTVHFTSSDGAATLPADSTLSGGVAMFTATLNTAGVKTLAATDVNDSSISGTSNDITVSAAAATHFGVFAPSTATAGSPFGFVVTAQDAFGNLAAGYSGVVHFTSADGQAGLPADSTLSSGTGAFSATLRTLGNQTLTATDAANTSITGTSNEITVSAPPAVHFQITAPANATSGTPFSFTVTALDSQDNTATSYTGTVHFTSGDASATLPADTTLTNGTATLSATLRTVGSQSLTATDTVTTAFTSSTNVNVNAALAISNISSSRWTVDRPNFPGTMTVTGGTGTYTLIASSNLPTGLTAVLTGSTISFTGTPTVAADFPSGSVTIMDAAGATLTKTFDITIAPAPTLGALTVTAWNVSHPGYVGPIAISAGTAPYSNLSVTGLPGGITASLSGSTINLSGTPTAAGTFANIVASVTDAAGATATRTFGLTINPAISFLPASLPGAVLGSPYSQTITAGGGTGALTVTRTVTGTVPPGLTVGQATAGMRSFLVSGTPTGPGSATITVTATDSLGATATSTYTLAANSQHR